MNEFMLHVMHWATQNPGWSLLIIAGIWFVWWVAQTDKP